MILTVIITMKYFAALLLIIGFFLINYASAACVYQGSDWTACNEGTPAQIPYNSIASSERRYTLTDCTTGGTIAAGMLCGGQYASHNVPAGHRTRFAYDDYSCSYCSDAGGIPPAMPKPSTQSHAVTAGDSNSNGIIETGSVGGLSFTIKNIGTDTAKSASIDITAMTGGINSEDGSTFTTKTFLIGNINPNSLAYAGPVSFRAESSGDAATYKQAVFRIRFSYTDSAGISKSHTENYIIPLEPAQVCIDSQCSQSDYYESWEYYCQGYDQWRHSKFYDYACASNACTVVSSNYVYEQIVQQQSAACGYADSDMQLLEKYSPVLSMHPNEWYFPRNIESMVEHSSLWKWEAYKPGLFSGYALKQTQVKPNQVALQDLDGKDNTHYLNLEEHSPTGIIERVINLFIGPWKTDPLMFVNYPTDVYGRVYRNYQGRIALQYWIFYPFNDWAPAPLTTFKLIDKVRSIYVFLSGGTTTSLYIAFSVVAKNLETRHEGDWELVQIILDNNGQPADVSMSQHALVKTYKWDEMSVLKNTHPKIYVALGDHVPYKGLQSPLAAELFGNDVDILDDISAEGIKFIDASLRTTLSASELNALDGINVNYYDPWYARAPPYAYKLKKIDDSTSWVRFMGKWGESGAFIPKPFSEPPEIVLTNGPFVSVGPSGPAGQGLRWSDPVAWSKEGEKSLLEQITGTGSNNCIRLGGLVFSSTCSYVSVETHSPVDIHAYDSQGRHVGPNATGGIDAEIPGTLLFLPSDGEELLGISTEDNIMLEITGTGTGTFSLTVHQYDNETLNEQTTAYSAVPVQKGDIAMLNVSQNNTALKLDNGGDGFADRTVFPDATENVKTSGLWHLDESDGTIAYDSGPYKINGTINGDAGIVTGKYGNARNFSGGYALLGDNEKLRSENISIEAWVKTNSASMMSVFTTGRVQLGSAQYGIALIVSNGVPHVEIGTGSANVPFVTGSTAINDGAWHLIQTAYVKKGKQYELSLVMDDKIQGTNFSSQSIAYASSYKESTIGVRKYGSSVDWQFFGAIDEVKISSLAACAGDCQPADNTPPVITIFQPINKNYFYTENLTLNFTASDDSGIANASAKLDNASVTNGQTVSLYLFDLGMHAFTAKAMDKANNTSVKSVNFTVIDDVPPISKATLLGVLDAGGFYINNATASIATYDEKSAINYIEYSLDNGSFVKYSTSLIIKTEGNHTLTFHAVDMSGNSENIQSISIKIKKRAYNTTGTITGFWRFDESKGNVAYDSGPYVINGQITGTAGIVSGVSRKARSFSGSGYALLGDKPQLRPENISVEAWIKTTSTASMSVFATGRVQLGSGTSAKQYGVALTLSNGVLSFEAGTGGAQAIFAAGQKINDGKWHFVKAYYAKTGQHYELALLVDGRLQGVANGNGPILYANSYKESTIGARKYGSTADLKFYGAIDEAKVTDVKNIK